MDARRLAAEAWMLSLQVGRRKLELSQKRFPRRATGADNGKRKLHFILMLKVSFSRENHGNMVLLARFYHFLVAVGTTGLNHGGNSALCG